MLFTEKNRKMKNYAKYTKITFFLHRKYVVKKKIIKKLCNSTAIMDIWEISENRTTKTGYYASAVCLRISGVREKKI